MNWFYSCLGIIVPVVVLSTAAVVLAISLLFRHRNRNQKRKLRELNSFLQLVKYQYMNSIEF